MCPEIWHTEVDGHRSEAGHSWRSRAAEMLAAIDEALGDAPVKGQMDAATDSADPAAAPRRRFYRRTILNATVRLPDALPAASFDATTAR
jgi:hypothetical protein